MASEDRFNSKNMFTGETREKGIVVSVTSGTLDITSAYYTVYDSIDETIVISETAATIDGAVVSAYIAAGASVAKRYAIFKYVDGSHTGKARLDYEVVQG